MRMHTLTDNIFMGCTNHDVTATGSGTGFDCRGYGLALISCVATTSSAATASFALEQSTDNSSWTAVGSIGSVPISQTAYVLTASVNLKNKSRYLRVTYTAAGSPSMTINYALAAPIQAPVTQTNGTVRL